MPQNYQSVSTYYVLRNLLILPLKACTFCLFSKNVVLIYVTKMQQTLKLYF